MRPRPWPASPECGGSKSNRASWRNWRRRSAPTSPSSCVVAVAWPAARARSSKCSRRFLPGWWWSCRSVACPRPRPMLPWGGAAPGDAGAPSPVPFSALSTPPGKATSARWQGPSTMTSKPSPWPAWRRHVMRRPPCFGPAALEPASPAVDRPCSGSLPIERRQSTSRHSFATDGVG